MIKGSFFLMPFSAGAHLVTINITLHLLTPTTYLSVPGLIGYNLAWIIPALSLRFYQVQRKERFRTRLIRFLNHYGIFCLAYFTVLAIIKADFSIWYQLFVLGFMFFLLIFYRWFFFTVRKLYKVEGDKYVSVVVVGQDRNLKNVQKILKDPEYGYRYKGCFHNNNNVRPSEDFLGSISDCYEYIIKNRVEEIFCVVSQLSQYELSKLISFADNNLKRIKLVPDNKQILTRAMQVELFGVVPVLSLRESPLEKNYAKYGKRVFDIVFSSLVIVLILSWLIPLLYVITRLEMKGSLFFRQLRSGYNNKPFYCYKFRSMLFNTEANTQMCLKNDARITKIGSVLRKTSIDELPQFFNVLKGEMSVVGPRPHMIAHTDEYSKSVDKYLVRHYAKPGITGLAQVKGYRGEIIRKRDIINRTRYDIFYLEKWSPFLDSLIIILTIRNVFQGEDKAY